MELENWFEEVIAPRVRADGGWLEIRDRDADPIRLSARGECAHCAALGKCLDWIGDRARKDLGLSARFEAAREPFLWRK